MLTLKVFLLLSAEMFRSLSDKQREPTSDCSCRSLNPGNFLHDLKIGDWNVKHHLKQYFWYVN